MADGCRAFQYVLRPTMRQERALASLLVEQCRLYNAALEERRGAWRLERRSVTRFEQYRTLTGLADQEPALMAFGVTAVFGLSDGRIIDNPKHLRHSTDALARAQRVVSNRQRGSRRRAKAGEAVAAVRRRIVNQRRDFLHKQSRALVNDHDVIVIEDLRIANMTRRPRPIPDGSGGFVTNGAAAKAGLNKSILDAGWGRFRSMLAYKAEEAGRHLIVVNPRHTSQRCAQCGHIDKDNRHGTVFRCLGCDHEDHADVNAAVNIRAGLAQRLARGAKREVA